MTLDSRKSNPAQQSNCIALGVVSVNDRSASVYVCDDLVIARFSDRPEDFEAQHMHMLTAESDVFLLAAFRLYLDRVGAAPLGWSGDQPGKAIES